MNGVQGMRRWLWLLVLGMSFLSFTACGGDDPNDPNNTDNTKKPGGDGKGPGEDDNPGTDPGTAGCEVDNSCDDRGSSVEGDACSATSECIAGLACVDKVCTPVGNLNQACAPARTCNGVLECVQQTDSKYRCVEVGAEGQPCPDKRDCDGDLVCYRDPAAPTTPRVCHKKLADGQDCASRDEWCESGSCVEIDDEWACTTVLGTGETCHGNHGVCGNDGYCDPVTDKCTPKIALGDTCDYALMLQMNGQSPCQDNGVCWYDGSNGDRCLNSDDFPACSNNTCTNNAQFCVLGQCRNKFPAGNYMCGFGDDTENDSCLSGNCHVNGPEEPATCN